MTGKVDMEQRDEAAKGFLHLRTIAAEFLMGLVPECRGMDKQSVQALLGDEDVVPGIENDFGNGRKDLIIEARLPGDGGTVRLWFDLEPQNNPYPLSYLLLRAKMYSAELGWKQRGIGGSSSYKYICKDRTYSIWILMHPPEGTGNTIREFRFTEFPVFGNGGARFPDEDSDRIFVICLGDPREEGIPRLLEMLDWAMGTGIGEEERRAGMENLGIEMDRGVERYMIEFNSISKDYGDYMRVNGKLEVALQMWRNGCSWGFIKDMTGLNDYILSYIYREEKFDFPQDEERVRQRPQGGDGEPRNRDGQRGGKVHDRIQQHIQRQGRLHVRQRATGRCPADVEERLQLGFHQGYNRT